MAKNIHEGKLLCTCSIIAREHQHACQQLTGIADLHVAESNKPEPEPKQLPQPQPQPHPDLVIR